MEINIDIDSLREDLETYYGTAMQYNPTAMMNLIKVVQASDEEIVKIARDNHFNLHDYEVKGRSR